MNQQKNNPEDLEIPQLGWTLNQLNRDLITAETPSDWEPAIQAMCDFLTVLDKKVISNPDFIAGRQVDSSRVFSILLTVIALGTQYRLEQFLPKKDEASQARRALIENEYIPAT